MNAELLIRDLGRTLGISLELSHAGTCRVAFDGDVVDFEASGESLWVMADLGPALHREDASISLLSANCLGLQTGGATIALDEERSMFTMHLELWGDMPYALFEKRLAMFVKALRWWKEWLALPPIAKIVKDARAVELEKPMNGEADGTMQDVYAPMGMPAGALRI